MPETLKILLADDEVLIRKRVLMMLSDRFDIQEARTAAELREKYSNKFDAVLLDIIFPDGNGIELCKEIKEKHPYQTVLISSSMETVESWDKAFQAGADGYLEKRELLGLDARKITLMINNLVERNCLRKNLEQLNTRQSKLLSVLSHDVRAPFHTLLGIIELLKSTEMNESAAKNVALMQTCAQDQLAFINSLLELLRLESGVVKLRKMPMDLNLPVHQSVQSMLFSANHKEIDIHVNLSQGLPKVNGDPARIHQLTNNLLSNAIKFSPRRGSILVETSCGDKNGIVGAELKIRDSGAGIPETELGKIFERFHRGRDKGTEGEAGAGLGLAICSEIMQSHNGFIDARSAPAGGALFTAWFPAAANTISMDPPRSCANAWNYSHALTS